MPLSKSSQRTRYRHKTLAWGVTNSGKSHLLFSAPKVGAVDYEGRAGAFDRMFDFASDIPKNMGEASQLIQEIITSREYETAGVDSLSIPYDSLVAKYTRSKDGNESTEYSSVNKHMNDFLAPLFTVQNKFLVCTARQTVEYEPNGKFIRAVGVKMVGDHLRWPYKFDYELHYSGRAQIKILKSMVPHLPVGTEIREDLDFDAWDALIQGDYRIDRNGRIVLPKPTQAQSAQAPAIEPVNVTPESVKAPEEVVADDVAAGQEDALVNTDPFEYLDDGMTRNALAFVKSRNLDIDDAFDLARIRTVAIEISGQPFIVPEQFGSFKNALIKATTPVART